MSGDLFKSPWDNALNPLSETVLDARASKTGVTSVGREEELKQRRAEELKARKQKENRLAEKRELERQENLRKQDTASREQIRSTQGGYSSTILSGGAGLQSDTGSASRVLFRI